MEFRVKNNICHVNSEPLYKEFHGLTQWTRDGGDGWLNEWFQVSTNHGLGKYGQVNNVINILQYVYSIYNHPFLSKLKNIYRPKRVIFV